MFGGYEPRTTEHPDVWHPGMQQWGARTCIWCKPQHHFLKSAALMPAKRSKCPLNSPNPPNSLPVDVIWTFLGPRRPSPTMENENQPTPQRSHRGHSTFCVVRFPFCPSKSEIGPRGRCCGLDGSALTLAEFRFPWSGMASEGPGTSILHRWEASCADSENSRGILSFWPPPNAGTGPPRRRLLPPTPLPYSCRTTGAMPQGLCSRSYAARAMLHSYAAGALLHELCCRGNATGAMLQGLCCRGYAAGVLLHGLCRMGLCCRSCAAGALLQRSVAGAMLHGLCNRGYAALIVVGAQRGSVLNPPTTARRV